MVSFLQAASAQTQITGEAAPGLGTFDKIMTDLICEYKVPAAQLAITYNGKLVLARGYGLADVENNLSVQPDSMFRIASNSKQITSVAILKLIEQGTLNLDDKAFAILSDLQPPPGKTVDPRAVTITIRQLLEHAGGYDRDISLDPMFAPKMISQALNIESPPGSADIIRWMLGRPLDFDPGTRSAYSNFGYCVLGRIIEKVTGTNYEMWVRNNILGPIGVTQMRSGNTLQLGRLPKEVKYYNGGTGPNAFPFPPATAPWSYGGWYIEAMDSHGGWVVSAIELMKFWNAIEGRRGAALLTPGSIARMTANPGIPDNTPDDSYGFGFEMTPDVNKGVYWFHSGFLDGQTSYAVRSASGYDYAAFFNGTPNGQAAKKETGKSIDIVSLLDQEMTGAFAKVTWPAGVDYFADYPSSPPGRPMVQALGGVANGASFARAIAPGSWVTIFGANLAGTTRTWGSADFSGQNLPQSLDGVTAKVDGKPAAVYFVSPGQINIQAPEETRSDTTSGYVPVEVFYKGVSGGLVEAELRQSAPGLFTYGPGAKRYAAAQFADYRVVGDPSVVAGTRAATPGDTISIYATGLGASQAGTIISSPVTLNGVTAQFGTTNATVTYAGLTGAGLFQVNVVVPNVADGDQAVTLKVGTASTQAGVIVPVKR
ncbi:MAG: serine hydrolase [Acidobacteriota bacterium]|nr:serine hydrolase [Acidobacteriota bacterium]